MDLFPNPFYNPHQIETGEYMNESEKIQALHHTLKTYFRDEDLQELCFALTGINYEELEGQTKSSRIRSLLTLLETRGRLNELTAWIQTHRPDINLDAPLPPTSHPQTTPPPAPSPSRLRHYLLGGILGFITGILGNLIAAWIQTDWMNNQFTTWGITILLILTIIGITIAAFLERGSTATGHSDQPTATSSSPVQIDDTTLIKSGVKTRGRGIRLSRLFSLGSTIDINTSEETDRDHE